MFFWISAASERPLSSVPGVIFASLACALAAQIALQATRAPPHARAEDLTPPPRHVILRGASLGEPIGLAQMLTLYLQAFDNQPGVSIPFKDLDYERVTQWLAAILQLDPVGQYPLLMASQLYAQVPLPEKQRQMAQFVYEQFPFDPNRRWRWLAHMAIMVKHRLNDLPTALKYAEAITLQATAAPNWARQMRIFLLEDMGEVESAKILLGGLLASGTITEPHEIAFLTQRLEAMQSAGKSSKTTKK